MQRMSSSNVEAEEALAKTKVHLMTKPNSRFLSNISMMLDHQISEDVPTAATDGKSVKYNPKFFLELSKEMRLGLLAHEVWHVAFLHMFRKGNKDHRIWNYAGDFVINNMLIESGFKIPEGSCYDPKYTGMSTEQVYELLIQEAIEPPPGYQGDVEYSEEEMDIAEQEVSNVVLRAVHRVRMEGGDIPSEIAVAIDKLINPKLDWKELLYRFVSDSVKDDHSWRKPNRKYYPQYYLPSRYSKKLNHLTVAIDTSGSITQEYLNQVLSEIQYINDTLQPTHLTVLDCDCMIHHVHHLTKDMNILDLEFSGRGGTSFSPVIQYCKDHESNLLIYFTDLEANQITEEQPYPILWVCSNESHTPAPVGTTIYVS